MHCETLMVSCPEREHVRRCTLESLRASGWTVEPELILDTGTGATSVERISLNWRRAVQRAACASTELVLLLEDDLVFGQWFAENLASWPVLQDVQPGQAFFASLYLPDLPWVARRPRERCMIAHPHCVWGSQALLLTRCTARYIDEHWDEAEGNPDIRMGALAGRVTPIYYHVPSLVEHADVVTTWGGMVHRSQDFRLDWRADELLP